MRVNIQKLQMGGGLLSYKPSPVLPSREVPPEVPEEEFNDDYFEKMMGKAITSDILQYSEKVRNNYRRYAEMPDFIKDSAQGRLYRSNIYNKEELIAMARNKEDFDALKTDKKAAMSNVAIKEDQVVLMDNETKDIRLVSITDYAKLFNSNPAKYKALTNREVVDLRENNREYANNDILTSIISNAVSLEDTTKQIREALSTIGSFSKGTTSTTVEQKMEGEGAEGLLSQGMRYIKNSEGELIQSNAENIKRATMATWSMLNPNMKTLLKVQAVHAGARPEVLESAAIGYAFGLLSPKETALEKRSQGEGLTGGTGKKATTSKDDLKGSKGWYSNLVQGEGHLQTVDLVGGTSGAQTGTKRVLKGITYGPIITPEGKPVGHSSMDSAEMQYLNQVVDYDKLTFGNVPIADYQRQAIVYNGGSVSTLMLPTKDDGTPDLDRAWRKQQAEDLMKPETTPTVRIELYKQAGFTDSDLTPQGTLKPTVLSPFATFKGTIASAFIEEPTGWMQEIDDNAKEDYYISNFRDEKGKVDKSNFRNRLSNNIIEGMVYIPYREGAARQAVMLEHQGKIQVPEYENSNEYLRQTGPEKDRGTNSITQLGDTSTKRFN